MPTSTFIIDKLQSNDWEHVRTKGDHWTFKHPNNPHLITIVHPRKDSPIGYVKSIEKISGVKLR